MLEQNGAPSAWGPRIKAYLMVAGLTALLTAALVPSDGHGGGAAPHRLADPRGDDG